MNEYSVKRNQRSRFVPAVVTGMKVLNYIFAVGNVRGSAVTTALDLNASTCHDVLKTLVQGGYLSYNSSSREYSIGPALEVLGARTLAADSVIATVRPLLRHWVYETEFTAFMAKWLPDRSVVIIDKIESTKEIKMTVEVGQHFPLTAAALGKAFMAYLDEAELEVVMGDLEFPPHTPNSIRSSEAWLSALEQVRECGWSQSQREFYGNTNAVVAPVFDLNGGVLFVVGSLAASNDLTDELLPVYGQKMRRLADESQKLVLGSPLPEPTKPTRARRGAVGPRSQHS